MGRKRAKGKKKRSQTGKEEKAAKRPDVQPRPRRKPQISRGEKIATPSEKKSHFGKSEKRTMPDFGLALPSFLITWIISALI